MQSNAGARGSVLDAGKGAEPGAALKLGRTLARTLRQRLRRRERRGATLRPTTDRGAPGPGSCLGRQSREQGSRYQPTGCVQGQPRRCARRLTSTRLRLIPTSGVVRRRVRFPLAPPDCRSQLVPSWQAPQPRHSALPAPWRAFHRPSHPGSGVQPGGSARPSCPGRCAVHPQLRETRWRRWKLPEAPGSRTTQCRAYCTLCMILNRPAPRRGRCIRT
jgi:hypothetical protein